MVLEGAWGGRADQVFDPGLAAGLSASEVPDMALPVADDDGPVPEADVPLSLLS